VTSIRRGDLDRALAKPDPAIRLWLFAGPDISASENAARRALAAFADPADPMAITDLPASGLAADPAILADEAASVSMFGGARAIRVTGAGEGVREAVELLLNAPAAGNPVVMTAGDLAKSSNLRKRAETADNVRILLSYPLEGRDAARWLTDAARGQGLTLAPGVGERLLATSNNDLGILASELQKFALYLDASPEQPQRLEADHLHLLGAESAEDDMFALVAALTGGNPTAVERQLRLLTGTSAIPALRAMARRLLQMAEARAAMDRGTPPAAAVKALRPPVFWKEQDAFAAALAQWPAARIRQALAAMLAGERAIKQPSSPGDIPGWQALLTILRPQSAKSAQ